jgi:hypothetical protein
MSRRPVVLEKVPFGQACGVETPVGQKLPAGHGSGDERPAELQ